MIINELYDGQGLGNQLWNYAVARMLAKKNSTEFCITGTEHFKGRAFMDISFGANPIPTTHYYKERSEYLCGTTIDISRTDQSLLQLQNNTKFDGNCQSTKYLEGYRSDILQWITIKDEYKQYRTDDNTCIIHVRFGDFTNQKDVFLPASYYEHAMNYLKEKNPAITFCIVTDEKDKAENFLPNIPIIGSATISDVDQNKAAHHYGGPIGIDFSLLLQAAYVIIPNSSFSWWAAYLNTTATIIIAPKYWARYNISDGYWSTSDIITNQFTYLDGRGLPYSSEKCWAEKSLYEAAHPDIFCTMPTKSVSLRSSLTGILRKLWKREKL